MTKKNVESARKEISLLIMDIDPALKEDNVRGQICAELRDCQMKSLKLNIRVGLKRHFMKNSTLLTDDRCKILNDLRTRLTKNSAWRISPFRIPKKISV